MTIRTKSSLAGLVYGITFYGLVAIGLLIMVGHDWSIRSAWTSDIWYFKIAGWILPFTISAWIYDEKISQFKISGNKDTDIFFDEIMTVEPGLGTQIITCDNGNLYSTTNEDASKWLNRRQLGWKGW